MKKIEKVEGKKQKNKKKKASAAITGDDDSLIQTSSWGVPVLVQPTLRANTEARADLHQRDIVIDGVNGFDF